MNELKKAMLIITLILTLGGSATWLETHCTRSDKEHADCNVTRCPYSQADLQRAHKKTPERCCADVCFYCGCPACEHTEE